MAVTLTKELEDLIASSRCVEDVRNEFLQRIERGRLTRDENSENHFCTGVFPFNPDTHQVFLVHHKKSGLWIAPGGHIDLGEIPSETIQREVKEELGLNTPPLEGPFLFTVNDLHSLTQICQKHYEIWYVLLTDGKGFDINDREFHETRWVNFEQAKELITDQCNLFALQTLEEMKGIHEKVAGK